MKSKNCTSEHQLSRERICQADAKAVHTHVLGTPWKWRPSALLNGVTATLCTGKAWEWVIQSDEGWRIWPTLTDQSSDVPSSFPAPGWSANCYHLSPFPLGSFLRASLHHKEFSSIAVITKTMGSVQFIPVSFLPVLLNLCFKWQKLF